MPDTDGFFIFLAEPVDLVVWRSLPCLREWPGSYHSLVVLEVQQSEALAEVLVYDPEEGERSISME